MFRRQLVGMLSAEGMSTRAIAPIVGKDHSTISRYLNHSEVLQHATPASEPEPAPVRKVTGLDGKQYPATKPNPQQDNKPKRRPLTDQFREATLNITRDCNRIERLTTDDRFKKAVNVHDVSSVKWTLERLEKVAQAFEGAGVTE